MSEVNYREYIENLLLKLSRNGIAIPTETATLNEIVWGIGSLYEIDRLLDLGDSRVRIDTSISHKTYNQLLKEQAIKEYNKEYQTKVNELYERQVKDKVSLIQEPIEVKEVESETASKHRNQLLSQLMVNQGV
ncbi:cell wall protein, partial [Bacillus cereus]